jgi:hypothetical protein
MQLTLGKLLPTRGPWTACREQIEADMFAKG